MTPEAFIAKWRGVTQTERASAQSHFIDLCRLLDLPDPMAADPQGEWFCFEKGATKAGGGDGWADVWRRGHFAWEYKSPGKDLDAAFKQLQLYTPALEYPPLLIVSNIQVIRIHTAFTGLVPTTYLRCPPQPGWERTRVARGGCHCRQSAVPGREQAPGQSGRGVCDPSPVPVPRASAGRGGSGVLLVREDAGAHCGREDPTGRAGRHQQYSRGRQPQGIGTNPVHYTFNR